MHAQATDDIGFELYLVRHAIHECSDFLASLLDDVLWVTSGSWYPGWDASGGARAMRLVVREQLTYSVQVGPVSSAGPSDLVREVLEALDVTLPSEITWDDGWRVPALGH